MKLREGTGPDGTVAQIGQIVIDWVCVAAFKHIIGFYIFLTSVIFKDDQSHHVKHFGSIFTAAWSECLQRLLQQPACSQSAAGPEKAGQARAGLPAALPGVPLQPETWPLELPGHPTFTPGEIPAAAARNPQTHSHWSPRCCQSGESCRSSTVQTLGITNRVVSYV